MAKGKKTCDKCGTQTGPRAYICWKSQRLLFNLTRIDENGIIAWGLDKNAGFCHIWMNGDIQNKDTGVWKTPHKILKLKPKAIQV